MASRPEELRTTTPAPWPLPRFGLGCAPIGDLYGSVDPGTAVATVHAAIAKGATLLDTAPKYGDGLSERRVGDALASVDRERVQISTKVGWLVGEGNGPSPAFGRDDVLRSLESSMRRLGVDHFDLVHVHDPDDHLDETARHTLPALIRLREEGVVGAIGAGMNNHVPLAELVRRTDLDVVLVAGRYTLLEQPALADLLPLCAERGVGVIAAGVFNSGLLANPRPDAPYNYHPVPDAVLERALAIRDVCVRYGVPLRAAALRFPLGHPAVVSVLVGAATPEEIADNLDLARHPVPTEMWADLRTAGLLDPLAPVP
ncbi:aldo/keto reductase (plasmid) [Streptomyces sp. NBC_01450]|uniref:aldo/keto reductase n=1 Tax=Streptomyces sp. NBC_01450 TaxID=2903871 RepID=UPI002E34FEAC|nr:aldo/keto reductase [Streptomyces sp. NBC_01450]